MKPTISDNIDMHAHAADVIDNALDELAARAGLWGVNSEPRLQLYLLGRLQAELDQRVHNTVRDCQAHDFTSAEIDDLLDRRRPSP